MQTRAGLKVRCTYIVGKRGNSWHHIPTRARFSPIKKEIQLIDDFIALLNRSGFDCNETISQLNFFLVWTENKRTG